MCISSSFPSVIQGLKKKTFWVQPSKWSDEWENISVMPCPLPQFISVSQIPRDCPRLEMIRDSLCHRKARMPPLPEACDRCRSSTAPGEDRGSLRRSGVFILFICIYPGPSWSLIRLCHFLLLTFPQCADAHFDMFDWSRRMMVAFCAFFLACAVNTTSNFILPKQQGLRKQCVESSACELRGSCGTTMGTTSETRLRCQKFRNSRAVGMTWTSYYG